jgi:hypothetical protein
MSLAKNRNAVTDKNRNFINWAFLIQYIKQKMKCV